MLGGAIYVGGKITSLGTNAQEQKMTIKDESKLKKYFEHYEISKATSDFKKIIPIDKRPWENKIFEFDVDSVKSDESIN